jgi:hypothetical protein
MTDMNEAQQIATDYQFSDEQYNVLKKFGAKLHLNGRELLLPARIYDDLQKNASQSDFKKAFYKTVKNIGGEGMISQIMTALKQSLSSGNTANVGGKTYYILQGHLTKNGNFNFPNPARTNKQIQQTKFKEPSSDMDAPQPKTSTNIKRTPESLEKEAAKYSTPGEFVQADPAGYLAYTRAVKKGLMPNLFPDAKRGRRPGKVAPKVADTPSAPSTPSAPGEKPKNIYNSPYFGNTMTTFDNLKEGQYIAEAQRLQQLAGLLKENK